MTDAATGKTRTLRGTPRWMLALLFASLAVNLVVVGSVAGVMWRHRAPTRPRIGCRSRRMRRRGFRSRSSSLDSVRAAAARAARSHRWFPPAETAR